MSNKVDFIQLLIQSNKLQQETILAVKNLTDKIQEINRILSKNFVIDSVEPNEELEHSLRYILRIMLDKKEICKQERNRKYNTICLLLSVVNLTLDNNYSEFYKSNIITTISEFIKNREDIKGDCKRKHIQYLIEFIKTANTLDSLHYKTDLIGLLANINKTKKADKNPHKPYTQDQLCKIFDPEKEFFKNNPDIFWICLIALFTGARQNAACTLQYNDICIKDNLQCIHFTKNNRIKHLKNEASERYVPIHPQLLQLGFLKYINLLKKRSNSNGTDFIFKRCQTSNGNYNDKLIMRTFTKYLYSLGIKTKEKDGFDFHSFRKNASLIMQNSNVIESYINDIIGWTGKTTMTNYYSNHSLSEIQNEMKKFSYTFLNRSLNKIKKQILKNV